MRLDVLDWWPQIVFLVHLVATQIVAGCENSFNCTECLRFNDCKFLRCAKATHCANQTDVNFSCPIEDDIDTEIVIDVQHCATTDSNNGRSNETIKLVTDVPIGKKAIDATTSNATVETTSVTSRVRVRTRTSTEQPTTPTPTPFLTTTSNEPPTTTTMTSVSSPMGHSTSIARRFDGPSFIGGIVLTIGLLSVAYVVFKFYWARTERNYHTLPGI